MPSISAYSLSTQRSSTFSIGSTPKTAGLRINSFINRRWELHPDIEALSRSLCGFDMYVVEELGTSSANRASHRRFSSLTSLSPSMLSTGDDFDFDYLGPETPACKVAKVQTQQVVPVSNLVNISVSKPTSHAKQGGNIALSEYRRNTHIDRTQATAACFDVSREELDLHTLIQTAIRPRTVHSTRPSTSESAFGDSVGGYSFPSPPKTPTGPVKHEWRARPRGRNPPCKPLQRQQQLWLCQYSPANAARTGPGISAQDSSFYHDNSPSTRDTLHKDDTSRQPAKNFSHRQGLPPSYPIGPAAPVKPNNYPLSTPDHHLYQHQQRKDPHDTNSPTTPTMNTTTDYLDPFTYGSGSGANTLCFDGLTLCNSGKWPEEAKGRVATFSLRKWWGRCFRSGKYSKER